MTNYWKRFIDKIKEYRGRSRFFSRNTTPKIISIIFALMMWLYVMGEDNPDIIEQWKNVDVQLVNVEELRQEGLVLIGDTDFTVNVAVKGKRNELYKVSSKDMVVRADLRGFNQGVNSVPLEYSAPTSINVEDISPKEIKVTLDKFVTRQKPVVVQTVGEAPQGYEPAKAAVSPNEVIVEGPETIVDTVSSVLVNVNLKDKTQDIRSSLPLTAVDSGGREVSGVRIREKLVEVSLPMYKVKEVPIIVDLEGRPKENYKITKTTTDVGSVVIKGPRNLVDQVNEIKSEPVNVTGLEETTTREMALNLPSGVVAPYLDKQPKVILTVEEVIKREFQFAKQEIGLGQLDEKYIIDISDVPEIIKVEVVAIESLIKDLEKQDIQLYLNLNGLLEGKYSANLLYNLPIEPDTIKITPSKVDFQIKQDTDLPSDTENEEEEEDTQE